MFITKVNQNFNSPMLLSTTLDVTPGTLGPISLLLRSLMIICYVTFSENSCGVYKSHPRQRDNTKFGQLSSYLLWSETSLWKACTKSDFETNVSQKVPFESALQPLIKAFNSFVGAPFLEQRLLSPSGQRTLVFLHLFYIGLSGHVRIGRVTMKHDIHEIVVFLFSHSMQISVAEIPSNRRVD